MGRLEGTTLVAMLLWLLLATAYQTTQQFFNVTPAQNTMTGVLTLPSTPRAGSERLYVNGVRQKPVGDYTISGAVITPLAANVSLYRDSTSVLLIDYLK